MKALRALAPKLGVTPEFLETGRSAGSTAQHEFRVAEAELELRLGHAERAEAGFRELASADDVDLQVVARARAGLGLLAARRNEPMVAIPLLEAAAESLPVESRPDVYETLGEAYAAGDQMDRAVALYERCFRQAQAREPKNVALRARFAACLAEALMSLGSLEAARAALAEAAEATSELSVQSRAHGYWAAAVEAWQSDDSERALSFIRRAIGLAEASEDALQLARTHMLAGRLLRLDHRHDEAAAHLERAERVFTLGGRTTDFGLLRAEAAHLAARRGDVDQALALAEEATRLFGDDARFRSNTAHALAVAHAAAGNVEQAEDSYRVAVAELESKREWREAAQVARELAQLLRTTGRDAEAYELLDHAAILVLEHGRRASPGATIVGPG